MRAFGGLELDSARVNLSRKLAIVDEVLESSVLSSLVTLLTPIVMILGQPGRVFTL